ncbi:hypothetical protein DH2020_034386 [Rehmannia glutinosa]|uniref:Uncharacterized protein n=1 Tax=Rehmannia glutinosa TaxID=99300 RepID=A0ABR0VA52_REHGL
MVNSQSFMSNNKLNECSTIKNIKGNSSVSDFVSPDKHGKLKEDKDTSDSGNNGIRPIDRNIRTTNFSGNELVCSTENPFWNHRLNERESETKSILMMESLPETPVMAHKQSDNEKGKKETCEKLWGFDGFKKWKKNDSENETAPLSLSEKSDDASYTGRIVANPIEEGPETKKNRLPQNGSQPDYSVNEIEEISTRHQVDNKNRCDRHGDDVLDVVVEKELNDHVREMGNSQGFQLKLQPPMTSMRLNECCGLSEDCTRGYIRLTRARFYGKWVCGLCSEAVNEESYKLGGIRNIVREEALNAHMNVCRAFNRTIRVNPAMSLAYAMSRILRTSSQKNA